MINKIRICLPESHNPYENLATEYYLMHKAEKDECILSLWRNEHTVVIGRNQNMYKECRVNELKADSGYPARRLSGGGAVFHDLGNLNFSFLVKDENYDVKKQLSVICEALSEFSIKAEISGRNDVTAEGRKISGNAFLREGDAHCHHGTLLISVSSEDMMKYLTPDKKKLESKGVNSVRSRVINLCEIRPDLTPEIISEKLIKAFEKIYGLRSEKFQIDEEGRRYIKEKAEMLSSPEWLYGKNPDFTMRSERKRFSWGSAEIALMAKQGKVEKAVLYTDALDENLSEKVSEILKGTNFQKEDILSEIAGSKLDPEVKEGLSQLLEEVF